MQPLVDAWEAHPGRYEPLKCVGRTAHYGPRDGAITTSKMRSAKALELARQMGITKTAEPAGVGFDDPLPGYPDAAEQQAFRHLPTHSQLICGYFLSRGKPEIRDLEVWFGIPGSRAGELLTRPVSNES